MTIGENWRHFPSNKPEQDSASLRVLELHATIRDKNTWEIFFVNAHYLKRQNYFQINGFLQTLRDPAFFGRPTNTSFQGEGGRGESVRLRCVENAPHVYNFRNSFVQDCR